MASFCVDPLRTNIGEEPWQQTIHIWTEWVLTVFVQIAIRVPPDDFVQMEAKIWTSGSPIFRGPILLSLKLQVSVTFANKIK
jgi:hypothetical protein